jgi:hypothetical protein
VELDQTAGKRQAQSCSTLRAAAALAELLKDRLLVRRRDPRTGVGDPDVGPLPGVTRAHGDAPSRRGEAQGIGQQVEHHLPELAGVGLDRPQPGTGLQAQGDPMAAGLLLEQGQASRQQGGDSNGAQLELHGTRLHLGHVEDVVDQGQEVAPRVDHVAHVLGLLGVQLAEAAAGEDLGEADDGVEGGAQLVAHAGQEARLLVVDNLQLGLVPLRLGPRGLLGPGQGPGTLHQTIDEPSGRPHDHDGDQPADDGIEVARLQGEEDGVGHGHPGH